jgi:hypothetical protein
MDSSRFYRDAGKDRDPIGYTSTTPGRKMAPEYTAPELAEGNAPASEMIADSSVTR